MKKFICTLLLVLCFSIPTTSSAASFIDVSSSHWAKEEIDYLTNQKIITGYSDGRFAPNDTLSRMQIALMLTRAKKYPLENRPASKLVDVPLQYKSTVDTVMDEGLFTGLISGSKFEPNKKVSREEMAILLWRAFNLQGISTISFKDVPVTHRAYKAVQALAANKVTEGYADNTFRPSGTITRAQFAAFVARTMQPSFRNKAVIASQTLDTYFYDQMKSLKTKFSIPLTLIKNKTNTTALGDELFHTFYKVLKEKPEIFYVNPYIKNQVRFEYTYNSSGVQSVTFYVTYAYSATEIAKMRSQIDLRVAEIVKTAQAQKTQTAKVKSVHDALVLSTAYDYNNYLRNTIPFESYTAYGALVKKVAVCQGYAYAMNLILNKIGIQSIYINGNAGGDAHGWNLVKVDGNWYHVDSTWDDPVPNTAGFVRYNYFLVSDAVISKDHTWQTSIFPATGR